MGGETKTLSKLEGQTSNYRMLVNSHEKPSTEFMVFHHNGRLGKKRSPVEFTATLAHGLLIHSQETRQKVVD